MLKQLYERTTRDTSKSEAERVAYLCEAVPFLKRYDEIEQRLWKKRSQVVTDKIQESAVLTDEIRALQLQLKQITDEFVSKLHPTERSVSTTVIQKIRQVRIAKEECKECGSNSMQTCLEGEVCTDCGVIAKEPFSCGRLSYTYEQLVSFDQAYRHDSYKRVNHFREYLRQVQGKSRANIPDKVFDVIENECKKHCIQTMALTPTWLRRFLRKSRLSRWYEHIPTILSRYETTFTLVTIDREHEQILCRMFVDIEQPYERIKTKAIPLRKNFMSYPFVAYKCCQLQGWKQYLCHFPLLKSLVLRKKQDRAWQMVCEELKWPFVTTVGNTATTALR
jgi:hypothetical protein